MITRRSLSQKLILLLLVLLVSYELGLQLTPIERNSVRIQLIHMWMSTSSLSSTSAQIERLAEVGSSRFAGEAALANGSTVESIKYLMDAVRQRRSVALSHFRLGEVYYFQGEEDKAHQEWTAAGPNYVAQFLAKKASDSSLDATERIRLASIASDLAPSSPEAHFQLGRARTAVKDCSAALEDFDQALVLAQAEPLILSIHREIGFARRCLGDHEGAIEAFKRSGEIDIRNPLIFELIADDYLKLEEYDQAIEYYEIALKLDTTRVTPSIGIGEVFRRMGNVEQSEMWFRKAVETNASEPEGYYYLGRLLLEQGRTSDAITNLERAVFLGLDKWWVLSSLASAYKKIDRWNDAVRLYELIVQTEGKSQLVLSSWIALAEGYERSGYEERARDTWQIVLEIDPENSQAKQALHR